MDISESGDGPSFNLVIVGQFNGGINQDENMANNANQDEDLLGDLLKRWVLKLLVCFIICGMIVTGTVQTAVEEQWFWAWKVSVFLLPLLIVPQALNPCFGQPWCLTYLVPATLIIGAYLFLASVFVGKAMIVAWALGRACAGHVQG